MLRPSFATLAFVLLSSCTDLGRPELDAPRALSTTPIDPITFDAVYVVNAESASISVINAQTNAVAATIQIEGAAYPHHLSLSPDRSLIALAVPGYDMSGGEYGHEHHSSRTGKVLLLDAPTGALRGSTNTDAANNNVVFAAGGTRLLTSQATHPGTTLILDTGSLGIRDAITVGTSPAETAISDDEALAFVANAGSSSVSVIDVAERRVRATIQVGAGPVAAVPAPGGALYVENEPDHTITVIDSGSLSVVRTFSLGYRPGTIAAPNADELWVAAPEQGAIEVRKPDGTVLHTVPTGKGAHAAVFSPDGTRAYVCNEWEGSVSVVDRRSMTVSTTIAVGAKPNGMIWRSH